QAARSDRIHAVWGSQDRMNAVTTNDYERRVQGRGARCMGQTRFSDPEHVRVLADPAWARCEGLIKAFEEAWRRGPAPGLGDYLRADGPVRRALLLELAHVDLEFRLKTGEPARVEAYLGAYPELAADRRAALEL